MLMSAQFIPQPAVCVLQLFVKEHYQPLKNEKNQYRPYSIMLQI